MQVTFRESRAFEKQATRLIGDESLWALQNELATNPEKGPVIPGGRGLRKVRWAASGRGKRGGTRVIYYHWVTESLVDLVYVYAKNEMSDLTRKQAAQLADALGL
ncbi:MAG: type II toxin-antitoxin system RelE/ParE family toxin [Gemmatimonadota bacterium]